MALLKQRAVTLILHLLQPLARLSGRVRHGLTVWRQRAVPGGAFPFPREFTIWSETWSPPASWLECIVTRLRRDGLIVRHGSDYADWDLEVRTGMIAATRLLMTVEEHGGGKQLLRFRLRPCCHDLSLLALFILVPGACVALLDGVWWAGIILGMAAVTIVFRGVHQCAGSAASILRLLIEKRDALVGSASLAEGAVFAPPRPRPAPVNATD